MTIKACLLLLSASVPAAAYPADAPYYGPMKKIDGWWGLGMKVGYDVRLQKDGSWRVDAVMRRGDALSVAMYRAAEMAREGGHGYVQFLGGSASRGGGTEAATVIARPSDVSAPPAECATRRRDACYTADAAEVMRILGGPDGSQPGVAIVDHVDRFGRSVFLSGFGIGKVDPGSARNAAAPSVSPAPPPQPAMRLPVSARLPDAQDRFEQALKEQQSVRGRDPRQGWTISD